MADLQNWSQNRPDSVGPQTEEDPVPMEEIPPEQAEIPGGATKTPEQMENLVELTRNHLPEIEEQLAAINPQMLLSDDQELPENDADRILELVDTWDDGMPQLLSGISPDEAIMVSQALENEIQEVQPILVGAWIWRAGELV
jgi:uncharacterized protein YecA (UPF0149 family)